MAVSSLAAKRYHIAESSDEAFYTKGGPTLLAQTPAQGEEQKPSAMINSALDSVVPYMAGE